MPRGEARGVQGIGPGLCMLVNAEFSGMGLEMQDFNLKLTFQGGEGRKEANLR